ncbi:MAG: homocysteine S-methyltransferase family protein, partial [Bacillota bacterium]
MDIKKLLNEKVIILDGAMGTMIPENLAQSVKTLEILNITHPEVIETIHKKNIQAGSQIIYTNTLGANPKKLPHEYDVDKVITAAVKIAKKATKDTNCLIALDIGSIGELMEPLGKLTFDDAYDIFAQQVLCGVKNNVDIIVFETISDLYEMKAAVLAAKENSNLPIIATMTFEKDTLRTFM